MTRSGDLPYARQLSQRELLTWARGRLAGLEGSNPDRDASTLLEWVLNTDNLWGAPDMVGAQVAEEFRSAVARRANHEPLQHIVGRMWFRGLELEARPGVFITRPETEIVAERAIEAARDVSTHAPRVVDLCTGSGAIAIATALEVPASIVWGVELDRDAVDLARDNVAALAPGRVKIVHGSATEALPELDGLVDVVVANPPYVPSELEPTQAEALHDPEAALYGGGEDGLVLPRGIVVRASRLLRPGGVLVVEHAEVQAGAMCDIALHEGFVDVATGEDLSGCPRMLIARRPQK